DYGEEEATEERPMACAVIRRNRRLKVSEEGRHSPFDLRIVVEARSFAPYADLFDAGAILLFRHGSITYEPAVVSPVSDFSGRVRHFEIDLVEARRGG
ncbi:MAG: hypothetical protein ACLGPL_12510, partial [Acidobacteriota bacterium]